MPQVLEQLQLSISPLSKHRGAKGLHDLLDGDILVGKLISSRAGRSSAQVSKDPRQRTPGTAGNARTRPIQRRPCRRAVGRSTLR